MELINSEDIIRAMLVHIGENPDREGLMGTPERVVRSWGEMYKGYIPEAQPKITTFDNNKDGMNYDQMIMDSGYFFSHCEHHMVPFFGQYYFGYIPDQKIVGLSKVARIVDYCSARLQVQERLGKEIVDLLEDALKPIGIGLILKGRHLCKEMRGIKKINGIMTTSELRGAFRERQEVRGEFMSLTNNK